MSNDLNISFPKLVYVFPWRFLFNVRRTFFFSFIKMLYFEITCDKIIKRQWDLELLNKFKFIWIRREFVDNLIYMFIFWLYSLNNLSSIKNIEMSNNTQKIRNNKFLLNSQWVLLLNEWTNSHILNYSFI